MNHRAKKKRSKNEDQQPYSFSDEATQKKKKHLMDIKDVITETDIANAKVLGKENDPVAPSEKGGEVTDDTIESPRNKTVPPWDTLEK